jgi:hypothetical protein
MKPTFMAVLFLALSTPLMPAVGWFEENIKACGAATNPDDKIAACTKVIEDTAAPERDRSRAAMRRGDAYKAKGDLQRAQADYKLALGPFPDPMAALALAARAPIPPEMAGVPDAYREALSASFHGKAFNFTGESLLFMGGIAHYLINACNLPGSIADRATLMLFVKASNDRAVFGADYSNPNVFQGLASQFSGGAIYLAGVDFARRLDCSGQVAKDLASGLARTVKANETGPDGGPPRFITTCTPKFSETRCECLAKLGRAVIPNIYQMEYHRDIIKRIVQGSPLVALQVGTACQISNY